MADGTEKTLADLFGNYRAEWLREQVYELFAEPSYFPDLKTPRPCVLEGGRGTGKTTVLRGLSYEGQYALHKNDPNTVPDWDFYGLYFRINSNHVRAFSGEELSETKWQKLFSHYFSLVVCNSIAEFLKWYSSYTSIPISISEHDIHRFCMSIHIPECSDLDMLSNTLKLHLQKFQADINNNIDEKSLPPVSLQGVPIDIFSEIVMTLPMFKGKVFYLLLDEYENLNDTQQVVINTLIKHSTQYYTYKIGVRELGWRVKHTLNPHELLNDPADYKLMNIRKKLEKHFESFARDVCQQRLKSLMPEKEDDEFDIRNALPSLSLDNEAVLLKVSNFTTLKKKRWKGDLKTTVESLSDFEAYFIEHWADTHSMTMQEAVEDYISHTNRWHQRFENYKYSTLFTIRQGPGSSGIKKYYSGWDTYIHLAAGNIRYLMELVNSAYSKHLESNQNLSDPISYKVQTETAQEVGLKNLMELEGLSRHGASLIKLILGLGRVFGVMAADSGGHAPEVNQFALSKAGDEKVNELLQAAVMNLALVRIPGTKLDSATNTREYLYKLHPIFSAYFCFSYRNKRKMYLSGSDLTKLVEDPPNAIRSILKQSNRSIDPVKEIPNQLRLFEDFYNA